MKKGLLLGLGLISTVLLTSCGTNETNETKITPQVDETPIQEEVKISKGEGLLKASGKSLDDLKYDEKGRITEESMIALGIESKQDQNLLQVLMKDKSGKGGNYFSDGVLYKYDETYTILSGSKKIISEKGEQYKELIETLEATRYNTQDGENIVYKGKKYTEAQFQELIEKLEDKVRTETTNEKVEDEKIGKKLLEVLK